MISTKYYANLDGSTRTFLSDFIIKSEQYCRVYNYVYNPNGVDGDVDPTTGLYIRTNNAPTSDDLAPLEDWTLVDNIISFYGYPAATSTLVLEVASTPEELGEAVAGSAVQQAEDARDLALQYAEDAEGYRDTVVAKEALMNPHYTAIDAVYANEANINAVNANETNINTVAGIDSDVTTVAGIDTDVTAVATNNANVTTVATNIADVNTVADDIANVNAVVANQTNIDAAVANATNINTVATDIANVNAVGTNISNVIAVDNNQTNIDAAVANATNINTVAANIADVNTVAADIANVNAAVANQTNIDSVVANATNINTVATNISSVNTVAGSITNVNAVANNETNVNTVATNISNVNTVGTSITNVNTVGANISKVTTVADNITNVNTVAADSANINIAVNSLAEINEFATKYVVSATAPSNPIEGMLWWDETNDLMKVYNGNGFVNAGSSVNGTTDREDYVVGTASGSYTGSLTTFPATYDTGYVDVYLNGVKLAPTTDFTATDGANVILASAAASGDTLSIVAYGTFLLADHYSKTEVDALIDDVETLALAGL